MRIARLTAASVLLSASISCPFPIVASSSVGAELRVVAPSGQLDDLTQYSDTTTMPTSPQAVCFGPGSGGSGQSLDVPGANALGIVVEAAKSRSRLSPLLLTDKFVPQGLGFGVCGIGGQVAQGDAFWYSKVNHVGLQVGGSRFSIHRGDQVLWYLAASFPPPPELVLSAPARAPVGAPIGVQVTAYDDAGRASPAAGAVVSGGSAPVSTDASGNAAIPLQGSGTRVLQATLGADIPSATEAVCLADPVTDCPAARGRLIVGTKHADRIVGTAGNDRIIGRGGADVIRARGGNDWIDVRGRGVASVNCGGGHDTVLADKNDKIASNCERVIIAGKKKGPRHHVAG